MTRAEAVDCILQIIDNAQPPADPVAAIAQSSPAPFGEGTRRRKNKASPPRSAADFSSKIPPDAATNRREAGDELDAKLAFYPLTDLGNAERFRERNRGRFLYTEAFGWFWWDGRRWAREGVEGRVKVAEHECVRAIQKEARAIRGTKKDHPAGFERDGKPIMLSDKLAKWGRSSEANSKLTPIARHAAAYMAIEASALDADPFKINVENGTLVAARTTDGTDFIVLREHNPDDLITKLAPVEYRPQAASGILNRMLDGLRDYLEHGLAQPKAVTEATEEYRRDSDQFGRFLEACTERDEDGRAQSSALLELHNAWARANAGTEYKGPGLAKAMEGRGFKKEKSSVFFWKGLRLTKTVNDFVDHEGKPLRQGEIAPAPATLAADEIAF